MLDAQPKREIACCIRARIGRRKAGAMISGGCSSGSGESNRAASLLEWLPPAEYDDGGELPAGVVTEYRIYVDQEMVQQVAPDATEYFPGTTRRRMGSDDIGGGGRDREPPERTADCGRRVTMQRP